MGSDELVLPFLASGGMWTLLVGIFLLWKYTERTLQQRQLMLMAATWFAYGAWYIGQHYIFKIGYSDKILSFERIVWGIIIALATVSYPIAALCRQWLRNRTFKILLIIPVVIITIYLCSWAITGRGFEQYSSYEQLRGKWLTLEVILRMVLWFISIAYNLITLYLILGAGPIYDRYIKNTYSDLRYNLRWIKVISLFFAGNIAVYTINIFMFEWWTRLLFMLVNFPHWVFLMEQGIFRKSFTPAEDFTIRWSWRRGWYELYIDKVDGPTLRADECSPMVLNGEQQETPASPEEDQKPTIRKTSTSVVEDIVTRMSEYMVEELPYTDSSLTREAFAKAVNTNRTTLLLAIKELGYESFQDYINRYRVEYFKMLAKANPNAPIASLFMQAGFATKSTFYRYFKEHEGILPGEFMEKLQLVMAE